jgi:hypothetical protein
MTGNRVKIRTTEKKSPVDVRRKSAKISDFQRIGVSWGFSGRRMGGVDGRKR